MGQSHGFAARRAVSSRLLACAALGLVAALSTSALAASTSPPLALEWTPAEGCPTRDALLAEIARVRGSSAAPSSVSVRLAVDHAASSWHAALTLTTSSGVSQRAFDGASCEAVAFAAALVTAVALDAEPEPAPAPKPAPPLPLPSGPPGPGEDPFAPERVALPPSVPPRIPHGTLATTGALESGSLPSVAAGVRVAAGWRGALGPGRLRIEADAALWGPQSTHLAAASSEGATLALEAFGGRACYTFSAGHLELGPCTGLEVERLEARGFSAHRAHDGTAVYGAWQAGALACWNLASPLSLRADLGIRVPVAPPHLVVGDSSNPASPEPLFTPASAALFAALGVEVRFL